MSSPDIGTEAMRDYYSVVDALLGGNGRISKQILTKPVTKGDTSYIIVHKSGSNCVYVLYPGPDEER